MEHEAESGGSPVLSEAARTGNKGPVGGNGFTLDPEDAFRTHRDAAFRRRTESSGTGRRPRMSSPGYS